MAELGVASLAFHTFTDCTVGAKALSCPPTSPAMIAELKREITAQNWDRVITHGPFGEYGHWQHKELLKHTTGILRELGHLNKLHTFQISYVPVDTPPATVVDERRFALMQKHFKSRGEASIVKWGKHFRSKVVPLQALDVPALQAQCLLAGKVFFRTVMECATPAA